MEANVGKLEPGKLLKDETIYELKKEDQNNSEDKVNKTRKFPHMTISIVSDNGPA